MQSKIEICSSKFGTRRQHEYDEIVIYELDLCKCHVEMSRARLSLEIDYYNPVWEIIFIKRDFKTKVGLTCIINDADTSTRPHCCTKL